MKRLLLVLALAGCASTGTIRHAEPQRASVLVQNGSVDEVTVFVLTESGHAQRVGRVMGRQSERVNIPRVYLSGAPVRLAVRFPSGAVLVADERLNEQRPVYSISSANNLLYVVPKAK